MIWAMMANYAAFGAFLFKYAHPSVPYYLELQDGNSLEQVRGRQPVLRTLWFFYRRLYLKADCIKAISTIHREVNPRDRLRRTGRGHSQCC